MNPVPLMPQKKTTTLHATVFVSQSLGIAADIGVTPANMGYDSPKIMFVWYVLTGYNAPLKYLNMGHGGGDSRLYAGSCSDAGRRG